MGGGDAHPGPAAQMIMSAFRHVAAERTIVFGASAVVEAEDLIGSGYTLLCTARTSLLEPSLSERAASVVEVPPGLVEDVAGDLRPKVTGARLVALGGGRVIDVAKALTAADGPRSLIAIPTTLSAAEMTGRHRHARGVPGETAHARASIVINDPALSASQPLGELAASSANSLGHATAALLSDRANPITHTFAAEAIRRMWDAWRADEPDRGEVALAALLSGWAVDVTGIGLHHVLAQTAVRTVGASHAGANAALLPWTLAAMAARRPGVLEALNVDAEALALMLRERSGPSELRALTLDPEMLERTLDSVARRPELGRMSSPPEEAELRAIYASAAAA